MECYSFYCGWRVWRTSASGVGDMLAWMVCLCGWCAGEGGVLAWVASQHGWHASICNVGGVSGMLTWVLLLLLKYNHEERNV